MGLVSQFTNLLGLLNFVVPLGLPMSMTKYVSENNEEKKDLGEKAFENSLKLILISSFIFSFFLILFSSQIALILTNDSSYNIFVIIIALFVPTSSLSALLEAYIRGLKNISLLTKFLLISSSISLIFTIPMVLIFKVWGAIISISGSSLIILMVYIILFKKARVPLKISFKSWFDIEITKKLFKIGIASLLIGAINQLTFLIIRIITVDNFGLEENGIYQSVLSISLNYFSFLFVFLSNYSFPKINEIKDDLKFLEEINETFRIFLLLLVPLIGFIIVFRIYLVNIFFSNAFINSVSLYKYQFTGDFFKALSWVIGLWLIPKNKIFLWVILELITYSIFPLVYIILIKNMDWGIESASIAYLVSNFAHYILNIYFIKRFLKYKFSKSNNYMFFLSLICIIAITGISEWNINAGYLILIPLLVVWFKKVGNENEKKILKSLLIRR